MTGAPPADAVVAAVLGDDGVTDRVARLSALQHGGAAASGEADGAALGELGAAAAVVDKVARHAYRITDEDLAAARRDGWSEHELFDLVVAAAAGAGVTRRAIGRAAVDRWERAR